ncbi:Alkanesulfonate utilization operon LysR-family regulator CbI [hydrothermal vent metagenome]|uniref:Alkanesulfonate utilization operon LysR-family regulator CbI n=1 Tax=hydrothermal vent metagenome TaxID=652676 RepID=A0A3B0Z2X1_9ZZZZ
MKLQQLRFVCEVVRRGMNVSAAADALNATQPGLSNQIRQLEEELNIRIFKRNGKRLSGLTDAGQAIVKMANRVLEGTDNITRIAEEYSADERGLLSIATTHTQARYALPPIIKEFTERYPKVTLHIAQGSPTQIAEMVVSGEADIAVATEGIHLYDELVVMPCYEWNRCVIVPRGHALLSLSPLTLVQIAKYPLVTYDFAFAGRSKINKAFEREGLDPNVVLTALDSDVIKTYVALGLGVGLLAEMAYDATRDTQLAAIDASHLFESSTTFIGLRRGTYLRGYMYDFILRCAPHLNKQAIKDLF